MGKGSTMLQPRKQNPGGRPTKFVADVRDRILRAIRAGNYLEASAVSAGVSYDTLNAWLHRGEQAQQGEFFQFSQAVKKARAEAELRNVAIIQTAAKRTWQAAAWWLERSFPDRWGRRTHEHAGPGGGPIQHEIDVTKLTDQELTFLLEIYKRLDGHQGTGVDSVGPSTEYFLALPAGRPSD